ncbi:MAG TPA: HAMP domain-containing sensor histidine kinase [Thermoanaerobaculia bacterium]|nr:HAMP domain-containing sensor histidine kinase [Thermoanaerobaculia bacterium]
MRGLGDRRLGVWPIALVVALLLALAVLQYRWIGEVGRLARLRLENAISDAMRDFAEDVDGEASHLATSFATSGLDDLDAAWRRWRDESPHSDLLAEVLVWRPGSDALERWDPASDSLQPTDWPVGLRSRFLGRRLPRSFPPRAGMPLVAPVDTVAWPPALVLPVAPSLERRDPTRRSRRPRDREEGPRLVLRLDERYLRDQLLPTLGERHFGGSAALPVEVTVLAPGPDGPLVVYSTRESPRLEASGGSLRRPLLRPRLLASRQPEPARGRWRSAPPSEGIARQRSVAPRTPRDGWLLVVDPRAGSLDAAVARLRWRNLAISAAVLSLLGVSLALVLSAARRQQELARRQLALVAGITHELHTPLAALSAAAQNLEDGVVRDPERVREYGGLVRREGARLQKLVDQTLALAGIRSGEQALAPEPVDLAAAIQRAAADSASGSPDAAVDVAIAPGAETARADAEALQRILVNLLANARKYGGGRIWIGARVEEGRAGEGDRIAVTVVDDGPGVTAGERADLFEPFHRGPRARELTSPGSGLGLYLSRRLAEAMGGALDSIDASRTAAPEGIRGAAFRLVLLRPTTPERVPP